MEAHVAIDAPPEHVFKLATNLGAMRRCFPYLEFQQVADAGLEVGIDYRVRRRGAFGWWLAYRISDMDPGRRLAGHLVGRDRVFACLMFDHRFDPINGGTISRETWSYRLRFGLLGAFLDRLFARRWLHTQLAAAQQALKEEAEQHARAPS